MKSKMICLIVVIVLLGLLFSGCFEEKKQDKTSVPLAGWLFNLDIDQLFFVTTTPTYNVGAVLTEEQVKNIIGNDNILPITTQIDLTSDEAETIILDYLNEINCSESIEIGEIELVEYRNRNPYHAYIPIFKLNETQKENYGIVTVSISGKYVAIPSIYCIQGELAYDFTIPNNSSSKEILLNYMQNNSIQGNIASGYYMMYYATDLDYMRSILDE